MDGLDAGGQMPEQHIDEVEERLCMLADQIVALVSEEAGAGIQAELLFSTFRALHSLKRLRAGIRDAMPLRDGAH